MMDRLPSGTVTFLFTDIENSTHLWEKHAEAMKTALIKHDFTLREAVETNHGEIIKFTGDGIVAVFHTAIDAINASLNAQRMFQNYGIFESSKVLLKIRMGIHTGEADLRDGDYYGGALNRAARIMSIGHGEQILISATSLQIAQEHLPNDVCVLDLGKHHLKGLSTAEHIYQISMPGLKQEFPVLKAHTQATNNLPTQLTSFIGRERELKEAISRLEPARILTLIGPGGTGKTRLSIQLGSQLVSIFEDGVWLVELAPISDPALIVQTIASTFGIGEVPGMSLKTLLLDFLSEKHLLIILDNCEHLIETSAKVADELLHAAPWVKIIASSREALGIYGETVFRVPSLALPEQTDITKQAAMGFESVQLFVERAYAANRKFQLTDENASAVAQICTRLDGIPLALELAASRITVFSPEQIAKRLDDRFKLLTGGSRTALPRQQTLRALIDWSYDLLDENERSLLRSLSVFAGGWTFAAAESICSSVDVLDTLPQLVNKSLVTVKEGNDEPRYYLLETIRQYALDKLLESGETEELRNRHLAFFLELTETARPELLMREKELGWIDHLKSEYDNIRTAIEWGLSNNPLTSARMVYSLSSLLLVINSETEGHRWGEKALKEIDRSSKNKTNEERLHRARLLAIMGILSFSMGDNHLAKMEEIEAVQELRLLGDKRTLALALSILAGACVLTGDLDKSISVEEEAITLAEKLEDKFILRMVLMSASRVEVYAKGNYAKAIEFLEKASGLLKENGNRWSIGISMYGFGQLYSTQRQFGKAREKYKIAMQNMQELGSIRNVIMVKSDLAHILRWEGEYAEAICAYLETLKEWQRLGQRAAVAHQIECLAFVTRALDQPQKALRLFGFAEALRQKIEIDMTNQEQEEYEKEVAELKTNVDENEFISLWTEGRSMTMEQVIIQVSDQ